MRWLGSLVLFALVLATFLPVLNHDFVGFDDPEYVTENGYIQGGLTWATIRWAFTTGEMGNWHPLTWLSHALDCQWFGLQPWGHHLTSVLLHALSTVFCFLALTRMTGAAGRSFNVAALFGLHPLRVESVAWVAERKDVLSTLFFMLTVWAYAGYAEAKQKGESREQKAEGREEREGAKHGGPFSILHFLSSRWYQLALGFFILGLMSKAMLVAAPFALLLVDFWPLGRWRTEKLRGLILEKIPFLLAALGFGVLAFAVLRQGGGMGGALPFIGRCENAAVSVCRYLRKLFWPVDLAAFYPPVPHWPVGIVLLAAVLAVGISVAAISLRRSYPYLFTGWFWFVCTLGPVSGLVPVGEHSMADRYSYVPSIGLLLALTWGVAEIMKRWRRETRWGTALGAGALALCAGTTRAQLSHWQNTETLFRQALSVTEANYLAHNNLGVALVHRGQLEEGIEQFRQALKIRRDYAPTHKNLGAVLNEQRHPEQALQEFQEALRLKPDYAEACDGLAIALEKLGRPEEAMARYQQALHYKPDYADAHYNLGVLLERQGRWEEAVREFQLTLNYQPSSADAHSNLGFIFEKAGQLDAALAHYAEAVRLRPDYPKAHFNLGVALSDKGRFDEAIAEFQEAVRLNPDYGAARTNLAAVMRLKAAQGSK